MTDARPYLPESFWRRTPKSTRLNVGPPQQQYSGQEIIQMAGICLEASSTTRRIPPEMSHYPLHALPEIEN